MSTPNRNTKIIALAADFSNPPCGAKTHVIGENQVEDCQFCAGWNQALKAVLKELK